MTCRGNQYPFPQWMIVQAPYPWIVRSVEQARTIEKTTPGGPRTRRQEGERTNGRPLTSARPQPDPKHSRGVGHWGPSASGLLTRHGEKGGRRKTGRDECLDVRVRARDGRPTLRGARSARTRLRRRKPGHRRSAAGPTRSSSRWPMGEPWLPASRFDRPSRTAGRKSPSRAEGRK